MDDYMKMSSRKAKAGIYSYLLSFVTSGLGIYLWFEMRDLISNLLIVLHINPSAWRAFDNFSFLLLGVLWLAFVFITQHAYQKSYLAGTLFRRVCLVIGIQMLIWFAMRLIAVLIQAITLHAWGWILFICAGGAGMVLILYARKGRTIIYAEEFKG
ncbi:hypothetical protein [Paenibacillus nasutitermitis]|uniref:Uncharacterized protein n=1 Tax=Paenibacillus nasutitermitis TaxID=1652958 RepID=A0A916ZD27_9BACL|nr:hypothetical protein [Paenibacillus nasutitermitis]GGD89190.1 hypothetical protein GCM10010911_54750 [Paenibacillus nasutitermitis]